MRFLRWIAGLGILAVLGWVGWWWAAAAGQETALEAWLEARAAEGWQAEGDVQVTGFPDRFDRQLVAPALADPEAGWAWSAETLSATSVAWDPTHIAVSFPPEQSLAVPGQRVAIASDRLDALFAVVPGLSLALREVGFEADGLSLAGQSGFEAGAARLEGRVARRLEGTAPENSYDISVDAEGVRLPRDVTGRIDPGGRLAGEVARLTLRGQAVTDRPLDRYVIETGEIGADTLVVREGTLAWGDVRLGLSGRLDADANGYAEGELAVEAEDWRRLLDISERSGAISAEVADAVRGTLGFVSLLGGSKGLDITLGFSGGRVLIGPVPVARAPRLRDPA
ncbi:MAG: DUF2125 domain-containing protein [Pseudomonadota bacterium]